jgi:hypothetical protein
MAFDLSHQLIVLVCICILFGQFVDALFLSDIPSPSFLIDVDVLGKKCGETHDSHTVPKISLCLPNHDCHFIARDIEGQGTTIDETEHAVPLFKRFNVGGKAPIGLMHSSVIRGREDVTSKDYDLPQETFLAEIDLPPSLCSSIPDIGSNKEEPVAELVLGVNNHHVGNYYWARSAGSGAFMEAPGIQFGCTSKLGIDKGILRWGEEGGFLDCNSNDGKRSEWVNFLRVGDNVQLLPLKEEDALISFAETFPDRIFGFSAKGRPLGSEPVIVCKWVKD